MVVKRSLESRESSFEQVATSIGRKGLQSLTRNVSPPPALKKQKGETVQNVQKSTAAAVEAGEEDVEDHLTFWSAHLHPFVQSSFHSTPRLDNPDWVELYLRNAGSLSGCHFVVHQHDHPVAGTHYDLRLQCNPTSSISFAIMYGLPGHANSRRLNRNATETRVHCLWNHLIETASYSTGSMLIWDTGEYEILPYRGEKEVENVTESDADDTSLDISRSSRTEQDKLKAAFQRRKIKLRLHGTRLPRGYTLALRLTKENDRSEQPRKPTRSRKRKAPSAAKQRDNDSGSPRESSAEDRPPPRRSLSSLSRLASPPPSPRDNRMASIADEQSEEAAAVASDNEDDVIRANNAYTGAINTVGSIHQRKWYLSIDREMSGFVKRTTRSTSGFIETTWVQRKAEDDLAGGIVGTAPGFDKFIVGGRETERSVVTGRLASGILADEGVVGYVPRGLWRPVTE